MRRSLRLALVVVGLAAVVYVTAGLTGRWLGSPPWWQRARDLDNKWGFWGGLPSSVKREAPGWISFGVMTVGVCMVALGAWPRRQEPSRLSAHARFDWKRLIALPCYEVAMLGVEVLFTNEVTWSIRCHRGPFSHPIALWGFGEWLPLLLVATASWGSIARPHFVWALILPFFYAAWLVSGG